MPRDEKKLKSNDLKLYAFHAFYVFRLIGETQNCLLVFGGGFASESQPDW